MAIDVCKDTETHIVPPHDPPHGGCDCDHLEEEIAKKQNILTAGTGISITNDVISSTLDADIFEVVQTLPQTGEEGKIYLVPKQGGGFTEWAYINTAWEEIGDTDIDLSNYYTKSETDVLLDDKAGADTVYTKTETDTLLDEKLECADLDSCQTIIDIKSDISNVEDKADQAQTDATAAGVAAAGALAVAQAKQDPLTAGTNVQIQNNVVSATDTTYTAGTNVTISANNQISAVDTKYTAGNGLTLTNTEFSVNLTKADLLTILGYEEIIISITDENNVTTSRTVLAEVQS